MMMRRFFISALSLNALIDILPTLASCYQWCILALWKIADYKAARGQDNTPYMVSLCLCAPYFSALTRIQNSAAAIYKIVAGEWDTTT
jgi:hypothetical protein